jgi:hypothetical protein
MHVVLILVHGHAPRSGLLPGRIDAVQCEVLGHCIGRRQGGGVSLREYALDGLDLFGSHGATVGTFKALGELDIKLDVQIAEVVVSERR